MSERKFDFKRPSNVHQETVTSDIEDLANLKSLLELSKVLEVDKQKIYRCVKKNNIKYQIINDKIFIDEVAQTRIKAIILQNNLILKSTSKITSNGTSKGTSNDKSKGISKEYIKQLITIINILEKELENKSEQLREKDKQIEELIKKIGRQ